MTTLALAGDVMLGRLVSDAIQQVAPQQPWGDVLPILTAADARIINLECAITTYTAPWTRTPKVFHFGAHPTAISVLRAAHISAVSLANNHILDFNEEGLFDTLRYLDEAGIAHAGAGRIIEDAQRPALFYSNGSRIGLIAITDNEAPFAATANRPGTYYLPAETDHATLAQLKLSIQAARDAGADLVVLSNHWGPNMVLHPPRRFCEFAHAAIELGVDVYYGHSAHLFQGVEIYGGKPILYDCGDFIDDYAIDPTLRNDWSFLFVLTLENSKLTQLELWPVTLSEIAEVKLAEEPERAQIVRRMRELSGAFGTEFDDREGRLVWHA